MYLRTQRRPTRRTLGDWTDWLNPISGVKWGIDATANAGRYYYDLATGRPIDVAAPKAVQPTPQNTQFIPGSGITDYLLNAITGKPTDAQIAYNTNTCVQSIQNMRQVLAAQGKAGPPPGAESACVTDQQAYVKLIGGTANQQAPTTVWAWVILAGVVGGAYLVTR